MFSEKSRLAMQNELQHQYDIAYQIFNDWLIMTENRLKRTRVRSQCSGETYKFVRDGDYLIQQYRLQGVRGWFPNGWMITLRRAPMGHTYMAAIFVKYEATEWYAMDELDRLTKRVDQYISTQKGDVRYASGLIGRGHW